MTELQREHLVQTLRTVVNARGCGHDFAETLDWAHRRRIDDGELLAWARALGAACDHELLARLE